MLKKFHEFINENEFTRLATHFMDKMDREYKFTSPDDNFPLKFITITFPDEVKITYKLTLNMYSDTETIKLNTLDTNQSINVMSYGGPRGLSESYLNLYGKSAQFDNYQEFRRIRFYMNRWDLFDTDFNGYIYDEGKLGASEIVIRIGENNENDRSSIIMGHGIFKGTHYNNIQKIVDSAAKIIDKGYLAQFQSKKERYDLLHEYIEKLEDIPGEIKLDEYLDVFGYLYLYYISVSYLPEIEKIFKNLSKGISASDVVYALYSMR